MKFKYIKIRIFKFDNTYIHIILINLKNFKIKFKYMKIRIFKFDNTGTCIF